MPVPHPTTPKAARRRPMSWRYGLFLLLCLTGLGFCTVAPWPLAVMAGFDVAAIGYGLTLPPLFRLDARGIRHQAARVDADHLLLPILTAIISGTILTAVASILAQRNQPDGWILALILATLVIAWLFSNLVYTLHYAHIFYGGDADGADHGGLIFPATSHPAYGDFAYFAFTLGMTFQTSDVTISSGAMRRLVLVQSMAAFLFNIGILAFSINILAG